MAVWAAVVGERGTRVTNAVHRVLDQRDPAWLPFPPAPPFRWTSADGTRSVVAWHAAGAEPPASVRGEVLTVATGTPRPRVGRWARSVRPVDAVADHHDRLDELAGHYTILSLRPEGGYAVADPFNFEALFLARDDDVTIVGNRSRLVAEILAAHRGAPPRRNPELAAYVAWAGYPVGDRTGYCDVEYLPFGHTLDIAAGGCTVTPPARHYLAPDPAREPTLDEAEAEIVATIQFAIDRSDEPPLLDLTGGKDTRLVLAVAMANGLMGEVRVITRGLLENADTRVAREIVDRFDLDAVLPPLEPRELDLVSRVRAHAERTDGLVSAFDTSHPSPDRRLAIAAHAGEIMRGEPRRDTDPKDLVEACRQFAWNPNGRAQFVDRDLGRQFAAENEARFLDGLRFTDDVTQLGELYEACTRNRWISSRSLAGPPRIFAAIPPTGVRYAWSRDRAFRASEPVHVPLIRAASEELLDLPLAKGGWNTRPVPDPFEPQASAAAPKPPVDLFNHRGDDWGSAITQILDEDPASPAFAVIDNERARAAAGRFATLGSNDRRQLLGVATAVVWMNETEGLSRSEWPA